MGEETGVNFQDVVPQKDGNQRDTRVSSLKRDIRYLMGQISSLSNQLSILSKSRHMTKRQKREARSTAQALKLPVYNYRALMIAREKFRQKMRIRRFQLSSVLRHKRPLIRRQHMLLLGPRSFNPDTSTIAMLKALFQLPSKLRSTGLESLE